MKTQILALLTLAAISFTSCKKDDDQAPAKPKSKLEMLTEEPWQAQSITTIIYADGQVVNRQVETTAGMTVDFRKDGLAISYENNVPVDTSAYSLTSDESIALGGFEGSVDILDESKLKITFEIGVDDNGSPVHEEVFDFRR